MIEQIVQGANGIVYGLDNENNQLFSFPSVFILKKSDPELV